MSSINSNIGLPTWSKIIDDHIKSIDNDLKLLPDNEIDILYKRHERDFKRRELAKYYSESLEKMRSMPVPEVKIDKKEEVKSPEFFTTRSIDICYPKTADHDEAYTEIAKEMGKDVKVKPEDYKPKFMLSPNNIENTTQDSTPK